MIPELRPYSGGLTPAANKQMIVVTQTDTVALPREPGGATGSEYTKSRLMNFLSDDPAPQDRDLDTLMSGNAYSRGKGVSDAVVAPTPAADGPPPAPPAPISLPPLETLMNNQLQQQRQDDLYRGSSLGSYAQDMYTSTRDILSRIAA